MKILPDESLPHKLRYSFGMNYEVYTVYFKGWMGKRMESC